MSIALPVLFAIAGLFSVMVMWKTITSNWDVFVDLRRQVMLPGCGSDIYVTFRDATVELDAVSSVRRPRQVRVPAPKPVTHRLHQYGSGRSVA